MPVSQTSIQPLSSCPDQGEPIASWFEGEWNIDPDETLAMLLGSTDCPCALVAFDGSKPVGALAYKRYHAEFQTKRELWINALYVMPEYRRQGLGRMLVRAGSHQEHVSYSEEIFVYTDKPRLYTTCGWRWLMADDENGMHTLTYRFTKANERDEQ